MTERPTGCRAITVSSSKTRASRFVASVSNLSVLPVSVLTCVICLVVIDPKGTLRQITVNDLPVGRSVDETIRLVKAFQFTVRDALLSRMVSCADVACSQDEFGEVCPANWQEGSKTMKADPKGKLEYFANSTNGNGTVIPAKRLRVD
jgi:alkyl hydroperoxide reductase subunit AhpC